MICCPSAQSTPVPHPALASGHTNYIDPAHMMVRTADVVNTQVVVVPSPYVNVVIMVARISVSDVEVIAEVEFRPCVEVPIGVIIPGTPYIIPFVPGNHPDAR